MDFFGLILWFGLCYYTNMSLIIWTLFQHTNLSC